MANQNPRRIFNLITAIVAYLIATFVLLFIAPHLASSYAQLEVELSSLSTAVIRNRNGIAGLFMLMAAIIMAKEFVLIKYRALSARLNLLALVVALAGIAIVFVAILSPLAELYQPT